VTQTFDLASTILPGILLGIPLGAFVIRRLDAETFRRICMSSDVWIVGFGLARVLAELKIATGISAYSPMLVAVLLDAWLLYAYFGRRKARLLI
jgi:hypothetical protein